MGVRDHARESTRMRAAAASEAVTAR
jgi:hypothetical protein